MKYYSLAHSGMFANLAVTTHDSAADARAFLAASKSVGGNVVGDTDNIKVFGGPAIVALFNAVKANDAEAVTRFTTKADGARRAFAALEARYQNQTVEVAAPSTVSQERVANDETDHNEENTDMPKTKAKKTKAAKAPKAKKETKVRAPKVKKERKGYSAKVKSSGGADSKKTAMELISRVKGATPAEIAEKVGCSIGSAKNLIWYLRRDGAEIILGEKTGDRRPYVVG